MVDQLQDLLGDAQLDALSLADAPAVRDLLGRPDEVQTRRGAANAALLSLSRSKPVYGRLHLCDGNGRERAQVKRSGNTYVPVFEDEFQVGYDPLHAQASQTLPPGAVYTSPLDWRVDRGRSALPLQSRMSCFTGVFGAAASRLGLVVLELTGDDLLAAFAPWGLSQTTLQLCNGWGEILAQRGGSGPDRFGDSVSRGFIPTAIPPKLLPPGPGGVRWAQMGSEVLVDVPVGLGQTGGRPDWWIRVLTPSGAVFAPARQVMQFGLCAFLLLLAISLAAGSWVSGHVTRPLLSLADDSRKLAAGGFAFREIQPTGDEFEELGRTFQRMARELVHQRELEQQLFRAERLAVLGQFAAEVVHEIGNPLAAMKVTLQAIQEDGAALAPDDPRLDRAVGEAERLAGILRDLRQCARSRGPEPGACDLARTVSDMAATLGAQAARRRVELRVAVAADCPPALVDQEHLQQVLFNLISNAIDASSPGQCVTVRGTASGDRVRLEIADTGPGIREEDLGRVFEAFFTTKVEGTGLGLWVTARLVRENGGTISVDSRPGHGATFSVEFAKAAASKTDEPCEVN
jgi:signal transduction histidine kinase